MKYSVENNSIESLRWKEWTALPSSSTHNDPLGHHQKNLENVRTSRSASPEVVTQAPLTHKTLIQRLEHEVGILRVHSERAISELTSELVAALVAYTELSAEVGTSDSSSGTRSWKSAVPETFCGQEQDPKDWFFELDCFFVVATDLSDPCAKVTSGTSRLRGDALKWWRQLKTGAAAEGIDYEAFKKQLCERFLCMTTTLWTEETPDSC